MPTINRVKNANNRIRIILPSFFKIICNLHAIEAYKIADQLAENGNCAAMWPDWWGFKMEAYDMVEENVAIVDAVKNSCAKMCSSSNHPTKLVPTQIYMFSSHV